MSAISRLFILLFISWTFPVQGDELPVTAIEPSWSSTPAGPTPHSPINDNVSRVAKMSSILIGCELNEKCILTSLQDTMKTDPDAVYETALLILEAQQQQMDAAEICANAESRKVKKEVAGCLGLMLAKFNQATEVTSVQVNNELNTCVKNKMENLGREGNLYAQGILVQRAAKMNDQQAKTYWEQLINSQIGTLPYENYQKCFQSFQLIPAGIEKSLSAISPPTQSNTATQSFPQDDPTPSNLQPPSLTIPPEIQAQWQLPAETPARMVTQTASNS